MSDAKYSGAIDGLKTYDVEVGSISLHITECGDGPEILFVHGIPDTAYTWHKQMQAVATAGYRANAPDMRGYLEPRFALQIRKVHPAFCLWTILIDAISCSKINEIFQSKIC